jgi:ABC-type nitrate/sulfonate/bicarbonate transport system ATPase subunit
MVNAPVLEAKQVTMAFNAGTPREVVAFRDISFTLRQGEILAIVGPSGCGKSTLFNVIAGLLRPTSGSVSVDGTLVDGARGHIGYMLQKDLLLPWRSVLDNVTLGLEVRGTPSAEARDRAMALIRRYGLAGFESARPRALSGGMRQRVAFMRTLALDPKAILLDEPFSALDFQTRLILQGDVKRIIRRAGAPWIDVMRPSGRDFPLQPHFGVNRIANWSPSVTTTITTEGLPITSVGTVSHPTLAATNLAASMRRWRLTSAAVVDSAAEQRSAGWACWRGNAAGLGGWTFVTRISLTTLQATGMGFFGLYGSTAALATTLTLATAINCIGIGFQRGTHTRWQMVANDGTGAPTLTDMGASFGIATGGVLTLYIAAPPNGSSVWVRVVDEVSGAVFEQEITADLPANTQFLSPRLFMNNGATAAAVAYDCSGVYVETDF